MASVAPRSALLGLYLFVSRRLGRVTLRLLARRKAEGKEHGERMPERMGIAGTPRPDGRLVWFHAASVGEAASLLELLRRLQLARPEVTTLVTTVTVTSERFLEERLPPGCVHQFAAADVLPWVERFLDHWRPDVAVWTESELWPATLYATSARGAAMLLINARISHRSYRRWRLVRGLSRALLGRFDRILAQDDLAGQQLIALGADPEHLSVTGSLKEGAAPLPHDEAERVAIARAFAGRPVWLAASTHPGEEEAAIAAHLTARRGLPMLALILAPRHPVRGDEVAALLRARGLTVAQRSKGEKIGAETDVYLADTLGEMGLWYRIASVSFIGGSLVEVGGHNPFEPALLGSAILYGPHVRNFADAYARLKAANAAIEVTDAEELGRELATALAPDRAAAMAANAWAACSEGAEVTDTVLETITALLDRPR
ncbi:3-deoxy-D-manno-octulosonic acid transferase [Amaricoccus solimangrovi]|uniref:3-deoxy-D-manno-octulosonic acid transferase n=1 Tax=Amaricoccus solimangrovi TaxID=2589815 RepID=A0A501WYI5_9RHOB|nr:3-deoxy-D-manno-octulosonic acid transferase [Amaricoccus solimangrovi]TPE52091.1 3-deoxy-D-manno-octulosonic acid transferase [Amaricoccus solimangrovi]